LELASALTGRSSHTGAAGKNRFRRSDYLEAMEMELANQIYNYERKTEAGEDSSALKDTIKSKITEDCMLPLYETSCSKYSWAQDAELVATMK
jgi:hypothetical protein